MSCCTPQKRSACSFSCRFARMFLPRFFTVQLMNKFKYTNFWLLCAIFGGG